MELFKLFGSVFVDNEKANDSIVKTDSLAEKLGNGFSKTGEMIGKAMIGVGVAITGATMKGVHSADELQKAVNQLGVETGSTAEEMDVFKDSIKNIYANNFGESFDDIAQSMADIKNQTGLTGEELEKATTNALMLRDTFEFEVSESTRAANQLMKEFGLTSDEAYTLMAQGAQNGLNANDDLMDVINEYSLHFSQLGFDAEEMFNMLNNGAKTGAFSVDKLGDAMKEFGIRVKDESKATMGAFDQLGLDAEEVTKQFAKGGEEAQSAFEEVIQALINTDDQVAQNQIGVSLFGTMWEDLGVEAISSLTDVNGEFDKTKDTLNQINEIKYDSFGEALQGIGRQLETGLFIPLGEKVLPKLNEFANYVKENMPQVQATFETILTIVGNAIGFVADKLDILIPLLAGAVSGFVAFQVISTVVTLYTTLKATLVGVTTVQGALNAVMAANPIGLVAIAIGGLIAVGGLLIANWDEVKAACGKLWQKLTEWFDDIVEGFNQMIANIINFSGDMFNAGIKIFTSLWNGYKKIWLSVVEWIVNILSNMVNKLFGTDIDLFESGKQIFNSLWDGFKSIWGDISSWVSDKVSWIADKLMFWRDAEDEMSKEPKNNSSKNYDGSHANGLSYVPFDGYMAQLHEGERVLTKEENKYYQSQGSVTVNIINPSVRNDDDLKAIEQSMYKAIDSTNRAMGVI